MEYKDYYKIIGVDKKASAQDIKHAYRRLARKYHPDVSKEKDAEEQFKNLQEAYKVLSDPEKRKAYDELGSNWQTGQEFRPPPGWNTHSNFYTNREGGYTDEEDLGGFSDFFSQLFGRGRSQAENFDFKKRGSDQLAKVRITLEEAFLGVNKTLRLSDHERTLKVTIPAGATNGQQLRLAGQGHAGLGGAPAGDLYLEIDIEPHRLFSLQGHDVYLKLPITPWEAALGAKIPVPTLAGPVDLKLSAGAQAGQKLRLKGKGMPDKTSQGDQYVVLQVMVPGADTQEKKQLYEQMAKAMPFNPRKEWAI